MIAPYRLSAPATAPPRDRGLLAAARLLRVVQLVGLAVRGVVDDDVPVARFDRGGPRDQIRPLVALAPLVERHRYRRLPGPDRGDRDAEVRPEVGMYRLRGPDAR